MKKLLLLALLIFFVSFSSSAAEIAMAKDRIHLKSGEFINGNIISRTNEKVIITDSSDGMIREYGVEEIDYISHKREIKKYNKKRFRGMLDFGYGIGVGSPRDNIFEIETSFGYQFNHYLYVGAGIGVHFHSTVPDSYPLRQDQSSGVTKRSNPDWRFPYVPLYLNVRSQLYESDRITPYIDARVGMSIFNYYGFYASPSIGVHFPTTAFVSLNLSVGCTLQHVSYKLWTTGDVPGAIPDGSGSSYILKKQMLSAIDFRVGFEF